MEKDLKPLNSLTPVKSVPNDFTMQDVTSITGNPIIDQYRAFTKYSPVLGEDFDIVNKTGPELDKLYSEEVARIEYQKQKDLANEQNFFEEWGNSQALTLFDVLVGQTLSNTGWLFELPYGDYDGNWLTDLGEGVSEWANENFQVHVDPDSATYGSFRPWDTEWWNANWPTIASWATLAIPSTAVVKGVSLAGKAVGLGTKMSRTAKWLTQGVATAVVSRHGESMAEASGTYKQTYDNLIQSGLSHTEAAAAASGAASANYTANLPLLALDIPQYLMLGRGMLRNQEIFSKRLGDAVSKSMIGEVPATYKALSKGGIPGLDANWNYYKELFKNAGMEGAEEAYQFISSNAGMQLGRTMAGLSPDEGLLDWLSDGELYTSAFFGALGGGGMHAWANSPTINSVKDFVSKKISKNEGMSSLEARIKEVQDRTTRTNANLEALGKAYKENNGAVIAQVENNMVFDIAASNRLGNFQIALDQLESMKNMSKEQLDKYGLDESFKTKIGDVKKKVEKAYDLIEINSNKYGDRLGEHMSRLMFERDRLLDTIKDSGNKVDTLLASPELKNLRNKNMRALFDIQGDIASIPVAGQDFKIGGLHHELKMYETELDNHEKAVAENKYYNRLNDKQVNYLKGKIELVKAKIASRESEGRSIYEKIHTPGDIYRIPGSVLPSNIKTNEEYSEGLPAQYLGQDGNNLLFKVRYYTPENELKVETLSVEKDRLDDIVTLEDNNELSRHNDKSIEVGKEKFVAQMSDYLINKYTMEIEEMKTPEYLEKIDKIIEERNAAKLKNPVLDDAEDVEFEFTPKEKQLLKNKTIKQIEEEIAKIEAIEESKRTKEDNRWLEVYNAELANRKGKSKKESSKNQEQAKATKKKAAESLDDPLVDNDINTDENQEFFFKDDDKELGDGTLAYRSPNNVTHKSSGTLSDRVRDLSDLLENPDISLKDIPIVWEIDWQLLDNPPSGMEDKYAEIKKILQGTVASIANLNSDLIGEIPIIGKIEIKGAKAPVYAHMNSTGSARAASKGEAYKQDLIDKKRKIAVGFKENRKYVSVITSRSRGYLQQDVDSLKQTIWSPINTKVNFDQFELFYGHGNDIKDEKKQIASDLEGNVTSGGFYIKVKTANGQNFPLRVFTRTINENEAELIYQLYKEILAAPDHGIYAQPISAAIRKLIDDNSDESVKGLSKFSKTKLFTYGELLNSMMFSHFNKERSQEDVNMMFTDDKKGGIQLIIKTKDQGDFKNIGLDELSSDEGKAKFLEIVQKFPRQIRVKDLALKGYKEFLYNSDIIQSNIRTLDGMKNRFFAQPLVTYSDLYEEGKQPKSDNIISDRIKEIKAKIKVLVNDESEITEASENHLEAYFNGEIVKDFEYVLEEYYSLYGKDYVDSFAEKLIPNSDEKLGPINEENGFLYDYYMQLDRIFEIKDQIKTLESELKSLEQELNSGKKTTTKKKAEPAKATDKSKTKTKQTSNVLQSYTNSKGETVEITVNQTSKDGVVVANFKSTNTTTGKSYDGGYLYNEHQEPIEKFFSDYGISFEDLDLGEAWTIDDISQIRIEEERHSKQDGVSLTISIRDINGENQEDIEIVFKKGLKVKQNFTIVKYKTTEKAKEKQTTKKKYARNKYSAADVLTIAFKNKTVTTKQGRKKVSHFSVDSDGKPTVHFKGGYYTNPMSVKEFAKGGEHYNHFMNIWNKYKTVVKKTKINNKAKKKEDVQPSSDMQAIVVTELESIIQQAIDNGLADEAGNSNIVDRDGNPYTSKDQGESYYQDSEGNLYQRLTSISKKNKFDNTSEWAESSERFGKFIDATVRAFFASGDYDATLPDHEEFMSDKLHKDLLSSLKKLKNQFEKNGEIVFSNGIVLFDQELMVAGAVDLMTVDKEGRVRIYDVKSMKFNPHTRTEVVDGEHVSKYETALTYDKKTKSYSLDESDTAQSKRNEHFAQLSGYNVLLNNVHGISAYEVAVIPFEIIYNANDTKLTKGITLHETYYFTNKNNGKPILITKTPIGETESGEELIFDSKKTKKFEAKPEKKPGPVKRRSTANKGNTAAPKQQETKRRTATKPKTPPTTATRTRNSSVTNEEPVEVKVETPKPETPNAKGMRNGGNNSAAGRGRRAATPTQTTTKESEIDPNEPDEANFDENKGLRKKTIEAHKKGKNFITSSRDKVSEETRRQEIERIKLMLPGSIGIELSETLNQVFENGDIAAGEFKNGMIYLTRFGKKGLAYHEAFHAVFNSLMSFSERNNLLLEAERLYPAPSLSELELISSRFDVSLSKAKDIYYEEQLAEDFRDYTLDHFKESPLIERLFRIITNFLTRLFNNTSYRDDIFNRIVSNQYQNVKSNMTGRDILYNTSEIQNKASIEEFDSFVNSHIKIVMNELEESGEVTKKCFTGVSKVKAANGLRSSFTKGSQWEVVKDLKGYPSHANGGVDIKFSEQGFSFGRNGADVKAEYGLVLPNISNYESE